MQVTVVWAAFFVWLSRGAMPLLEAGNMQDLYQTIKHSQPVSVVKATMALCTKQASMEPVHCNKIFNLWEDIGITNLEPLIGSYGIVCRGKFTEA